MSQPELQYDAAQAADLPRFPATADGRLTPAMRSAFEASGVILLEDFVPVEECRRLVTRARELVDGFDPAEVQSVFSTTANTQHGDSYFAGSGDRIRFFFEDGAFDANGTLRQDKQDSLNKIGHALHDLDPVFSAFSRTPKLAAAATSLGLDDAVLIQSMYIFKPPHIGGEVVCHQDSTYIYTEPETCTGFWFALEDATVANGCMYFIPDAHKGPLKRGTGAAQMANCARKCSIRHRGRSRRDGLRRRVRGRWLSSAAGRRT